jgi:hypothetical protein
MFVSSFDYVSPGLPSDFRDIVMKEFDSQLCLQFSQLATKRKWSISADISTYNNSSSVWEVTCRPAKVTLFGEPAQVCANASPASSFPAVCFVACNAHTRCSHRFFQEALNGIQMISYEKRDP